MGKRVAAMAVRGFRYVPPLPPVAVQLGSRTVRVLPAQVPALDLAVWRRWATGFTSVYRSSVTRSGMRRR
jgi:hypothetical protein